MSDCEIKDGECINPYHQHNDRQEPPQKEAASTSSIPKPDIDEILNRVFRYGLEVGKLNKDYQTLNESVDAKSEKKALYDRLASEADICTSPIDSGVEFMAVSLGALAELMGVEE